MEDGATVVRQMLTLFRAMLEDLAEKHPEGVILVPTQGTLHDRSDWHDELHPSAKGFDAIVTHFSTVLRKHYPDRLP